MAGPSSPFAGGPLRRPDLIASPMEPDRPAAGQVALHFDFVGLDSLLAGQADPAGAGAVPRHAAVLLRQIPGEYLLTDRLPQLLGSAHGLVPPSRAASKDQAVTIPGV